MTWISFFTGIVSFVGSVWSAMTARFQRKIGQQQQQNADLRGNVAVQAAMAQSVANVPKTREEALQALRKGKE